MKLIDINKATDFIKGISDTALPFKTAYTVAQLLQYCEYNTEFYLTELRKIFKECVQFDEDGAAIINEDGGYKIIEGKEQECAKKLEELSNLEVEDPTHFLSQEMLESTNFTPSELSTIMPFIR